MYRYEEKLNSLTESSVWVFTKQSISFDTACKAVKLLSEIPDWENVNIEDYFAANYSRYGINTHRHRVLVISQLFGLLTKTPLYARGSRYNIEQPTEIFELLSKHPIGSPEYNTLKTEQILKIKIKAIIDTANNNQDWNILPTIFTYKVLKILKEEYNISSVTLDEFYTYIMTCADYSEVGAAVEYIRRHCPPSGYVSEYKDRSRFLTLFQNNFNLFHIVGQTISINETFDTYFNDMFMKNHNIDELHLQLARDVDYTYFLTTHQDFGVNLIDEPAQATANAKTQPKQFLTPEYGKTEDEDANYVAKVNEVKESNINPQIGRDAGKVKPNIPSGATVKRYHKNPIIGKIAIQNAQYLCENESTHTTFASSTTKKPYMEAHHLIPISFQEQMWRDFGVNVDCVENIVSLCPNCHRAIHYGMQEDKIKIITKIYGLKSAALKKLGLHLSLEQVIKLYS